MHKYWDIIKNRWSASKNKTLFLSWIGLRIRKLFKYEFSITCLSNEEIVDIVIPTVSKDYSLLSAYLEGLKNICQHINKVYIVSNQNVAIQNFCESNGCIFVDELSVLGYGKDAIKYNVGGLDRSGWIFQQLLKLSGDKFVEKQNYIIVDSDTILLTPQSFIQNGQYVFFQNEEWHEPYFESFKEIFGRAAITRLSFTSHMMVFNTEYLKAMKKEIETLHKMSWDQVYLGRINNNEQSCISDYELYANWVLLNHPQKVYAKPLYNITLPREKFDSSDILKKRYGSWCNSVSFHSYVNSK